MNKITSLLNNFDPYSDFWTQNPQLRLLFKEEYDNQVPSEVMWALFLHVHPESKYIDEDTAVREKLIKEDYLGFPDFSFEDYAPTIEKILSSLPSKVYRTLLSWKKKLEERELFIESIPYNSDNYEMLDKLLSSSSKLYEQFSKIEKAFEEEEHRVKGEVEESLSEQGKI